MRDLSSLRQGWAERNKYKEGLLSSLSVQEGVQQFLCLYDSLAPIVRQTQDLFHNERETGLISLQARLYRFAKWQRRQHGQPVPKRI